MIRNASLLRRKQRGIRPKASQSSSRILAALAVLDQGLPEEYGPVLQLIGLHRRFVDMDYLAKYMLNTEEITEPIQNCFALLETAGLLSALSNNIFRMHPALQSHLERQHPAVEALQRAFVDFMGRVAEHLTSKELHEQRVPFMQYQGSFHHALNLAEQLDMDQHLAALTQGLAAYALNSRDYLCAAQLFADLAEHWHQKNDPEGEAGAYHQLGIIAQEQRDFAAAELWCKKSLAIEEKQGNENGVAKTYHQLGRIAEEQRDFSVAEQWYKKTLAINKKQNNEYEAATTYHHLGNIAAKQGKFNAAKQWCQQALAIEEKQGNEHSAANSYHQLGNIAYEQEDVGEAKQWYRKALTIFEKQGDELSTASIYHHLGNIAQKQRDFAAAEQWYKKSLAIFEKQGDKNKAAFSYYNLGSLAIKMKQRGEAGLWFIKSIQNFSDSNDQHNTFQAMAYYVKNLLAADPATQTLLRQQWQQAGLEQHLPLAQLE